MNEIDLFSIESILKYFRRTGLIGDTPPRIVVGELINEATRKHKEKFDRLYRHQLVAYVQAAKQSNVPLIDRPDLIGPWWDVIREFK